MSAEYIMHVRNLLHRLGSSLAIAAVCASLVLAECTPAHAKLMFRGPSSYFATGSTPSSVSIADLDRDGNADLVVTNSAVYSVSRISSISILKGIGDGTYEPHHVIPVGNVPQAVVIEDFDGDGFLDLAISNFGEIEKFEGTISVLLGNGDATFRSATDYPAGDKLRSLSAADLDGDRDLDLVTEDAVLLGNGDGTFGDATTFGSHADWYAAVGDVNRDGHPDLVTSNIDAEWNEEDDPWLRAYAVRLGNGDGTFQEPVRQGEGIRCMGIELADLDGDALLDLVVVNHGDDRGNSSGVLVHTGRGNGTFGAARFYATRHNPMSVAIADLNGDGLLDLATANNGDDPDFDEHSLTILLGNGDGTFRRGSDLHAGSSAVYVAAGRLDSNATWDLVAVDLILSRVSVFLGNGDATFGTPDRPIGRHPLGLVAADFDHDGRTDLASTNGGAYEGPGGISVILGNGDATFRDPLDSHSIGRDFLVAANLDGDLAPDLVVAAATGITVMLANGDGTFRELAETYLDPRVPLLPALDDFDRDGRMDIAVPHHYSAPEVSILLGREGGSFGPISRVATGPVPTSAAAGDLDGDGVKDLVLGLEGHSVSVLLGHGDGTFAPHVDYFLNNYSAHATPVALADLDEDGRLDVVNGNFVWMGNGDGTLRPGTHFETRQDARSTVLEDLDGDRHVDIALLYGEDIRMVSVHPGRGDGTFGTGVDYGTGAWPRTMTAGDFDGDGRTDLAVSNNGSQSISLLVNRSQAPVIPVRFELRPAVLNPRAGARWITGIIELTPPRSVAEIDLGSIRLNGTVPANHGAPGSLRRQGSSELLVQFDRAALAAVLPAGQHVPVTITGMLGRDPFEGNTVVRVLWRGFVGPPSGATRYLLGLRVPSPAGAQATSLRLGITLEESDPARLDLLDIAGRVIRTRDLASFAAGEHEIELSNTGSLAPGVYFIRLRQGARQVCARAAIVR